MNKVYICGGSRIPFVKSFAQYSSFTNQELMTEALRGLVDKFKLQGKLLGDVALGTVMKHTKDWNLARECVLGCGLHPTTPGVDIARACGTGLEATIHIANKIKLGQIEIGIAGGTDTNSDIPLFLPKNLSKSFIKFAKAKEWSKKLSAWSEVGFSDLKPETPKVQEPRTGLSMGEHCEKMAQEWKIPREDQDVFSLESHQKAAAAYERGFYRDMVVSLGGVEIDTCLRKDTSLEKLAKLPPAFDKNGTLSAGNSTALTDGASCVLLASEKAAAEFNLPKLAEFKDAYVSGVDFVGGEGLLMAPTIAVAKILQKHQMHLQDFDLYEIHEAFAAQVLCTFKAWQSQEYCERRLGLTAPLGSIDREKLNLAGGSLALGHPFAATGGRIVATLAKLLSEKGRGKGLISICTGGGMGVVAILEKTA